MNNFEKLIYGLSAKMPTPTNYGWFHLMFVGIVITLSVVLCLVFARRKSEKTLKIVTLVTWLTMFLFEIYKQIVFSFDYDVSTVTWDYQWYAFPYQLCSTPLYVLPLILILKDGKLRNNLMLYISTFAFFGGLVVFIYPNDVFIQAIGINIQTMVHHGLQIVIGIFYAVYNRDQLKIKNFFCYGGGIGVFLVLLLIAIGLNVLMPNFISETFNMFYVGPVYPCTLVILNQIYAQVPYFVFLMIYSFGFILAAFVIYLIYVGIAALVRKARGRV